MSGTKSVEVCRCSKIIDIDINCKYNGIKVIYNNTIRGDMMAQLSIRIDDDVKKQAEQLFNSLGMSMSTAFSIFAIQSIKHNGIPFSITNDKKISDDPFFDNPNNLRVLRSGLEDSKNGRLVEHELIGIED